MARTVWKFACPLSDLFTVAMPAGAVLLCVQRQGDGDAQLWAEVDPDRPRETRAFRWIGTGHPLPANVRSYVGTVQLNGGALVFHLYEVRGTGGAE